MGMEGVRAACPEPVEQGALTFGTPFRLRSGQAARFPPEFCRRLILDIVTRYAAANSSGQDRCGFRRGEQAQHRVGYRESLGECRGTLDLQLSRRAAERERRGVGWRVWGKDAAV